MDFEELLDLSQEFELKPRTKEVSTQRRSDTPDPFLKPYQPSQEENEDGFTICLQEVPTNNWQ